MKKLWIWSIALIVIGSLIAHWVQTAGGTTIKDLRFTGDDGQTLSALLYVPDGVTAENPAPGILAVHGYINSREVQSPFAIELARRGYVVLSLDQSGHGYSEGPAFSHGFGGPAALRYLRSLDIVDVDNIGLEGHSMGGWTVLAAAAAMPDAYQSMVLQGSSTGSGFAAEGTAEWPRNVSVVFAQYDEFAPTMWGVAEGSNVANSEKLQTLFGVTSPVQVGRVYGSVPAGTARVLQNPPVTHPGNHISHTAVAHALDWFALTLDGANPAINTQIWFFKELGTLMAFVGIVLFILAASRHLLQLPAFQSLNNDVRQSAWETRSPKWWGLALAGAFIPVISFYPIFSLGSAFFPANTLLPQSISNQVLLWALVNGGVLSLIGVWVKGRKLSLQSSPLLSLLLALLVVAATYLVVLAVDFLFKTDFRFWFVGLKRMSLDQFRSFLAYLPLFAIFFVLLGRSLHTGLSVGADNAVRERWSNTAILAGGFFVFLVLQYGSLFMTGQLLTPSESLNTIVMIQFVPLLVIVAVISTWCWRLTGHYWLGAWVNSLLITWYIVAGQATHVV
jgi:pimeloyl-ACP methyl ester carboxylesterase